MRKLKKVPKIEPKKIVKVSWPEEETRAATTLITIFGPSDEIVLMRIAIGEDKV
jgi:hypothetical protein